jgi:chromosome segregation ATPase
MDAAPGKRKKDPQIAELRAALEQFQDIAETYRQGLEAELAAARAEEEPYNHLIRALERQIASLRNLEAILDDRLWPDLIALANGSAYVQHARTREYF